MFGQPGGLRRRIEEIVARFREKGAVSPDKAMTAQELGLPPRFEEAMKRRLGATGIFVDVGGKYYLDEARLKQVRERRGAEGGTGPGWRPRGSMSSLWTARMIVGLAAIVLAFSNLFLVHDAYLSLAVVGLVVLWIALTAFQLSYRLKMRNSWGARGMAAATPRSCIGSLHER